jgi:CheY-like chemotaxis protein
MSAAVLLAEPEPQARGLLEHQLSVAGFAVVEAGAGAEALTLAEQASPDLVLVGNELPDASAAEFCRRLRGLIPIAAFDVEAAGADSKARRLRRALGGGKRGARPSSPKPLRIKTSR